MMEGYAAAVEACKVGSPSERAVNAYVQSTYTAAMARAADELRRIAGELGVARGEEGCLDRLRKHRQDLEQELEALEKDLATVSAASEAGWMLSSACAEEPGSRRRRKDADARPVSRRLQQLPWSVGVFRQGGDAVLEGKGPF
ncbi:Wdr65 [Symbiodinium pilosum]|uniref:Wdr65 protein n=1 Tax=Symbiodinium pilosum TaxID=2952 RepID=A0A812XK72_SYMPI|nr:Wdr65 [Symbiodinium pilosum]